MSEKVREKSLMEEKVPGLGRCLADCAATGWALSTLQTAAGDSRVTHQSQQASGQAGISSSQPETASPSQLQRTWAQHLRVAQGLQTGPKRSTAEMRTGPALGITPHPLVGQRRQPWPRKGKGLAQTHREGRNGVKAGAYFVYEQPI